MNSTVVEQLRSVVAESGVFSQLAGAGVTEQWARLAIHSSVLTFIVLGLSLGLRRVKRYYDTDNEPTEGEREAERVWTWAMWVTATTFALLVAVLVACDAVTLYQYHEYPRAMVLRDILKRI
jgi:ABC-type Fe3+ transport system permease subunit